MNLARALSILSLLIGATLAAAGTGQEQDYEAARKALEADLARLRPHRLEIDKGKGYVLCETLLKTAKRLHPTGMYRPLEPVLTWREIFAIPGIAEPKWTDLNPLEYEGLLAKLHELYEITRGPASSHKLSVVDAFFARDRYDPPVCPQGGGCSLPVEERRKITLEGYRDFVKSGGRMRMAAVDIGSKQYPFPVALIQYEYASPPAWSLPGSQWYGFTFYAKPDLSDRIVGDAQNVVQVGPKRRLVLYRGRPHIVDIEEGIYLEARHLPGPQWECWIVRSEIEGQP
jgi:hypothetical protein